MMNETQPLSVLFVCLGNICRSPTAHGVFQQMALEQASQLNIAVDSCGTAHWHTGRAPDARAVAQARKRGYDLSALRARQVRPEDFAQYDYILAMDKQNLADLREVCPSAYSGELRLFLEYAPELGIAEVPDPYYGGEDGFAGVLDMVEAASEALLREIRLAHSG